MPCDKASTPSFRCPYDYLFEDAGPWSQWCAILQDDEDTFLLAPWIYASAALGDPEIQGYINYEAVTYGPVVAEAGGIPGCGGEVDLMLFLGRTVWRNRNELPLETRQRTLTKEGLDVTQTAFRNFHVNE
jgi:hypothetical protein